ncbi:MAG TPA: site-2 protease family protein [Candidatus Acidoferrales bacterium]|nr:site-2 protease family protein [Candidatus Acidoferrales bacterium]
MRSPKPWLHVVLFLATFATTTFAGALLSGVDVVSEPRRLTAGLPFALTLMAILLVHELGHYTTARAHGVRASLPFFIPAPTFIGTFGAFIAMRSAPPDRRALFDVAAAGPLAGVLAAIPAVVAGLSRSTIEDAQPAGAGVTLGSSLLLTLLTKLTLGQFPQDVSINLHPIGFAGWIGLFITALNLLPVGQLDGGHIVYALFGARHIWISRLAFVSILSLGLLRWWDGWLVWGILLLFLGFRHPPCVDSYTPLDFKRKILGWFMIVLFIFTFIPAPFSVSEPPGPGHAPAPRAEPVYRDAELLGQPI